MTSGTLLNWSPVALIRSFLNLGKFASSASALASVMHRPRTYRSRTWEKSADNAGSASSLVRSSNVKRACSAANGELRQLSLRLCATEALPPNMRSRAEPDDGSPTQ
ncbi:hypothetical protein D3C72_649760 [compost metagenome]